MSKCKLCLLDVSTLPPWAPASTGDLCGFCRQSLKAAERFINKRGGVSCLEEGLEREAIFDIGVRELDYDEFDDGGFSALLPVVNGRRQLVYGKGRHKGGRDR